MATHVSNKDLFMFMYFQWGCVCLVWGLFYITPHSTQLHMKNHRINFWVWIRANSKATRPINQRTGGLYSICPNLSQRDDVCMHTEQTLNAKNTFRSALGLSHLLKNSRHLCILYWTVFIYFSMAVKSLSIPLMASAPSVRWALRVIPAVICWAHRTWVT